MATKPALPNPDPNTPMEWREQQDGSENFYTVSTGLACPEDEDRTIQSGAEDADINTIMRRFHVTGDMPAPPAAAPFYGDFTQVTDYQSALAALEDARQAFDDLPAEVRRRFADDPGELISFVQDDSNRAEAARLGLLEPKPLPEPPPAPIEAPKAV